MKKYIEEEYIVAKTHTPEYMLHKYWSRKPYNVIQNILASLLKPGDILLDPFFGSGVILREALLLGANIIGIDINPIAYYIANLTIDPPNYKIFEKEIIRILKLFEEEVEKFYLIDNQPISYLVHEIIVECERCSNKVNFSEAIKDGRKYHCPYCNNKLNFNLKNLEKTNIKTIILQNGKEINDEESLKKQEELENSIELDLKYSKKFLENKRILTFLGMETKDLFTKRNFYLLTYLADLIHGISDLKLKKACLVLFTSSVAQCSRLIAYRNNLKTGGPAWSVPGFWVPPIHLESNPYKHLYARSKKMLKAIEILNKNKRYSLENSKIILGDSLEEIPLIKEKVDLVFLDPPYGDNIPYTEFSSLWNSFLNDEALIEKDISVSDRENKELAWKSYEKNLNQLLKEIKFKLKENGKILVTFNNHDIKAWKALLKAFQENEYKCCFVKFQIPAVVSAKAQFSPEKSYIGDIYCLYEKENKEFSIKKDLTIIKEKLIITAISRENILYYNIIYRIITTEWLKNNIDYLLLDEINKIIAELFDEDTKNKGIFYLKDEYKLKFQNVPTISHIVKQILKQKESNFYEEIIKNTEYIGIPDPIELKRLLESINKNNKLP